MRCNRALVEAAARDRLPGYLDAVRAVATVVGPYYVLSEDAYNDIRGRFHRHKEPTANSPASPATLGPQLWAKAHRQAMAWDGTNPAAELHFAEHLADRLASCACKAKWKALLANRPPDVSSPAAYVAWWVWAHNEINAELGKPAMTEEAARERWQGELIEQA